MVWSLLVPRLAQRDVYSGGNDSETCPFLFLRRVLCQPGVEADEKDLISKISDWLDSSEMQEARRLQKGLDVSDLTAEVRLAGAWGGGVGG